MYGIVFLILPRQIIHFKINLINTGHHKNSKSIGKQKYLEPGVEKELNFELFQWFYQVFNNDVGLEASCFRP